MLMRMKLICSLGVAGLMLAACGTTPGQRALTGGLGGAAVGGVVGGDATGAVVGGAAGAALGAATAPDHHHDRRW
jgi:hypothetical protein